MSVATAATQAGFCATFVDELLAGGVTDAVVCPGSRSTPMTVAIARSGMRAHVRLDERSAGFFALGLARASERPVLVVVTSGTAAAELLAAVTEAGLDRVPLIVVTADRPPELHDIGAPQTMKQRGLFDAHAVYSIDPGPVVALPVSEWRALSARLVLEAKGWRGLAGPAHFNAAFREPLLAEPSDLPPRRTGGGPWLEAGSSRAHPYVEQTLPQRTVLVVGEGGGQQATIVDAAVSRGWPVLADPRSQCRIPHPNVVTSSDGFLRDAHLARDLRPDAFVLLGAPPASKVFGEWLRACVSEGSDVFVLGPDGPSRYPFQTPARFLVGDAADILDGLTLAESDGGEWVSSWAGAEQATQGALDAYFARGELSEPAVARALMQSLGDDCALVCSSSMPIRDVEWFGGASAVPLRVYANRGANGIDGVVSTAMGVATARSKPTVLLIGDLAFLHDVSSLVDGIDEAASLLIVVLDNGGGGIFSFLPQRTGLDEARFEMFFGTPRKIDPSEVARGFGLATHRVATQAEFERVVHDNLGKSGITVVCVTLPSRDENVATHAAIEAVIARAVAPLRS